MNGEDKNQQDYEDHDYNEVEWQGTTLEQSLEQDYACCQLQTVTMAQYK